MKGLQDVFKGIKTFERKKGKTDNCRQDRQVGNLLHVVVDNSFLGGKCENVAIHSAPQKESLKKRHFILLTYRLKFLPCLTDSFCQFLSPLLISGGGCHSKGGHTSRQVVVIEIIILS